MDQWDTTEYELYTVGSKSGLTSKLKVDPKPNQNDPQTVRFLEEELLRIFVFTVCFVLIPGKLD